MNISII